MCIRDSLDAFLGVVLSDGLRTSKPLLTFSAKGDIFAGLDLDVYKRQSEETAVCIIIPWLMAALRKTSSVPPNCLSDF